MKRIYSLITGLVILVLVAGATAVRAQRQTPEGGIEARVAATTDTTFAHFFLQDPLTSDPWWQSHTVVDGSGGVHVAFFDTQSIYYAHCAANCSDPNNWLKVPLFAVDTSLVMPTLGVDDSGRPRLMFYASPTWYEHNYYYAECNANCAENSANWTSVAVAQVNSYSYPFDVGFAALDNQDRPHLVYPQTEYPNYGINYLTCDSGCTTASNWYTTTVVTPGLDPDAMQLVFDPNGRPRVLGYDSENDGLMYAECNSNCSTAANWGSVVLPISIPYIGAYDGFALRADAQGRPRIAYYDGADSSVLYYAWSNASPLTAANWHSYTLNYPGNSDFWSVDLALDSQGRPAIAFATDELDLSYITCTANCETNSPTWQQQLIETGADLEAAYPIPPSPGCSAPTWMVNGYPSLALDAADNLSVSYWVRHGQLCNGGSQIVFNASSIRFATTGGAVTPTAPTSVGLNGPAIGVVDISYTFTATVTPITATTPITFVWQATGQTAQTHTGRGTSDTTTFTWPSGAIGVKTITVSASNQVGTAHGNRSILISVTPIVFNHWVYLPAVLR